MSAFDDVAEALRGGVAENAALLISLLDKADLKGPKVAARAAAAFGEAVAAAADRAPLVAALRAEAAAADKEKRCAKCSTALALCAAFDDDAFELYLERFLKVEIEPERSQLRNSPHRGAAVAQRGGSEAVLSKLAMGLKRSPEAGVAAAAALLRESPPLPPATDATVFVAAVAKAAKSDKADVREACVALLGLLSDLAIDELAVQLNAAAGRDASLVMLAGLRAASARSSNCAAGARLALKVVKDKAGDADLRAEALLALGDWCSGARPFPEVAAQLVSEVVKPSPKAVVHCVARLLRAPQNGEETWADALKSLAAPLAKLAKTAKAETGEKAFVLAALASISARGGDAAAWKVVVTALKANTEADWFVGGDEPVRSACDAATAAFAAEPSADVKPLPPSAASPQTWRGIARETMRRTLCLGACSASSSTRESAHGSLREALRADGTAAARLYAAALWDEVSCVKSEGVDNFAAALQALVLPDASVPDCVLPGGLVALLCHHADVADGAALWQAAQARAAFDGDSDVDIFRFQLAPGDAVGPDADRAFEKRVVAAAWALEALHGGSALGGSGYLRTILASAVDAVPQASTVSKDEIAAFLGKVTKESDAPSLFSGSAKAVAAKAPAKGGKSSNKMYGADDAAWAADVAKEMDAKKSKGVDAVKDAAFLAAVQKGVKKVKRAKRAALRSLRAIEALAQGAPGACRDASPSWAAAALRAAAQASCIAEVSVDAGARDRVDSVAAALLGAALRIRDSAMASEALILVSRGLVDTVLGSAVGGLDEEEIMVALEALSAARSSLGPAAFALVFDFAAKHAPWDVAALRIIAAFPATDERCVAALRPRALRCAADAALRGTAPHDAAKLALSLCAARPACTVADVAALLGGETAADVEPLGLLGPAAARVAALCGLRAALAAGAELDTSHLATRLLAASFFQDGEDSLFENYAEDDLLETASSARDAAFKLCEDTLLQLKSSVDVDALVELALADDTQDKDGKPLSLIDVRAAACLGLARSISRDDSCVIAILRRLFEEHAAAAPTAVKKAKGETFDDPFAAPSADPGAAARRAKDEEKAGAALRAGLDRRRARVGHALKAVFADIHLTPATRESWVETLAWVAQALGDDVGAVREAMHSAGEALVNGLKSDSIPLLEHWLSSDGRQEAIIALLGVAAKHLDDGDARVGDLADKLADALLDDVPDAPPPPVAKAAEKPKARAPPPRASGVGSISMLPPGQRPKPIPKTMHLFDAKKPAAATAVVAKKRRTASEASQVATADGLAPLLRILKKTHPDRAAAITARLLAAALGGCRSVSARRGAAHGVAASIKGCGIGALKQHSVVQKLDGALTLVSSSIDERHGALVCIERLAARLGVLFEPYEISLLPALLKAFSENGEVVRGAAKAASVVVFEGLSAHGMKLALPAVLAAAAPANAWRERVAAIEMLGATAHCAPKQLATVLPKLVPALADALGDTHQKVRDAAKLALGDVADVAKTPEIRGISSALLDALVDPAHATRGALEALLSCEFAHVLDAPSLALIAPILHRGLRDRAAETKRRAALVTGNLSALSNSTDVPAMAAHMPSLQPLLEQCAVCDAHPDVRLSAALALQQVVKSLGAARVPHVVQRLVDACLGTPGDDELFGAPIVAPKLGDHGGLLSSDGASERAGAAQALAMVLRQLGALETRKVLEDRIFPLPRHGGSAAREGALWAVRYLSAAETLFEPHVGDGLTMVLHGLSDDADAVRETALLAGKQLVRTHGARDVAFILPTLEGKLLGGAWRIRAAAAQLLGELLCLVGDAKAVGFADGDDDDAAMGDIQAVEKIIAIVGAASWRNILSSLYIARLDSASAVRQAAVEVWKMIVPNTPKALRDILPTLVRRLVSMLTPAGDGKEFTTSKQREQKKARAAKQRADDGSDDDSDEDDDDDSDDGDDAEDEDASREKQHVASRALVRFCRVCPSGLTQRGDVVKKIGDRVIPELVPLLVAAFETEGVGPKVGACLGLAEVASSATRQAALDHLGVLAHAVERFLVGGPECVSNVRRHAALAFHELHCVAGAPALEAILPRLLNKLDDDEVDDDGTDFVAVSALAELAQRRPRDLVPIMLPHLLKRPVPTAYAVALSAIAAPAKIAMGGYLGTVVRTVLTELAAMDAVEGAEGAEAPTPAEAARRDALLQCSADSCVAVSQAGDASAAIGTLATNVAMATTEDKGKPMKANSPAAKRTRAAQLAQRFFDTVRPLSGDECVGRVAAACPPLLKELVIVLADENLAPRKAAAHALAAYADAIPSEAQAEHLDMLRVALASTASDARIRLKRVGDAAAIPALHDDATVLKALSPAFIHVLLNAKSPEERESAANGLRELVDLSSATALKPLAVKLAGPLIRVVGDRFAASVKAAIVGALAALLRTAPLLLKAFVPQLQATFAKALRDEDATVRRAALQALELLVPISTRLDALVVDLCASAIARETGDPAAFSLAAAIQAIVSSAKKLNDAAFQAAGDAADSLASDDDAKLASAGDSLRAAIDAAANA